jgi:hypothetical protein
MEAKAVAQPSGTSPGLALYQMAVGHYFSRALAAKLGIADLLKDGPRNCDELAQATRTHPPSLKRVMLLLASAGVFEQEDNGHFTLTPLGEFLRTGVSGSMRSMVLLFAGVEIQDSWKELEYCVQTGEPAFRRNSPDADHFLQIAQNPEQAKVFDEAMATFAPASAIAVAYDFSRFSKLVDVGGGNGALLTGILKTNPNLRGIVFDLPHVADKARNKIAEEGLQSRCQAIGATSSRKCRAAPTLTSSSTSSTTGTISARLRFLRTSIARCVETVSC